jgi:hypothetical protein
MTLDFMKFHICAAAGAKSASLIEKETLTLQDLIRIFKKRFAVQSRPGHRNGGFD